MPDDNYLPDFTTPNQITANRLIAAALLKNSMETPSGHSGNVTAVSPFGGLAQMTNALAGRSLMNQAGDQERSSMVAGARDSALTPPGAPQGFGHLTPPVAPSGFMTPQGGAPMSYADATASQESADPTHKQGNYAAVGPVTSDGDRAYGRYQVKGSNIPEWTARWYGKAMTPQEFINNPQAQDAVYRGQFGEYVTKFGPEGAARAWYGGPGAVNHPEWGDKAHPNAPTVGQYGQNFSQALQFSGEPQSATGPAPDAQSAITMALQGGRPQVPGPGAPNMAIPHQAAPGYPGGSVINPALVPQRQQVSREQMIAVMANPFIDPAIKQYTINSYYSQFQPQQLQGPYGSNVLIGQNGQQQVIPGAGQWDKTEVGDIKVPGYNYVTPPGYNGPPPGVGTLYPGGGQPQGARPAAPAAAPPAPAPSAPPQATPIQAATEPPQGGALPYAEEGQPQAPGGAGPIGTPPPAATPASTAPGALGTKPPPLPEGAKVAETPMPGVLPPWIQQAKDWEREQLGKTETVKDTAAGAAKQALDYFGQITDSANSAANERPLLDAAGKVIEQPNFYSGLGSNAVMAWKRGMAALTGDNSAAAMESFEKMRNDLNLSSLRTKLGGLGQIRLAEVHMVNNAFANLDNSVAANKALIYLAQRINDRVQEAGQKAYEYTAQHGGNPDIGLKKYLYDYYKDKPLMDDGQIKQFESMISTESKQKPGQAQPNQPTRDQIMQEIQRRKQQAAPQAAPQPGADIPL